jgi:regulator of protease activity HflC (stomatin/prohibitin superfamily)
MEITERFSINEANEINDYNERKELELNAFNKENLIYSTNNFNEEGNLLVKSNTISEKILLHPEKGYTKRVLFIIILIVFIVLFIVSLFIDVKDIQGLIIAFRIIIFICIVDFCSIINCRNVLITIQPNEAIVYEYYGKYIGTVKEAGFFYFSPYGKVHKISLKTEVFNGNKIKVCEREGNPVELGIIVNWKVEDTAKAIFNVKDYKQFIEVQSEAAIKYVGSKYPYEPIVPGEASIRSGNESINTELKNELQKRVSISGIIIEDARITEASYGVEVAKMMLQKQASASTVYARQAIASGATNAIVNSLNLFENNGIEFKKEEKANYVYEMMNVLCSGSEISQIQQ